MTRKMAADGARQEGGLEALGVEGILQMMTLHMVLPEILHWAGDDQRFG